MESRREAMEKGRESKGDWRWAVTRCNMLGSNPFQAYWHGEAYENKRSGGVVEAKSHNRENSVGTNDGEKRAIAMTWRTPGCGELLSRRSLLGKVARGGGKSRCPKSIHGLSWNGKNCWRVASCLRGTRRERSHFCERNNIAIKQVTNHQGIMHKSSFIIGVLGTNIGYIRQRNQTNCALFRPPLPDRTQSSHKLAD